MAINNLSVDREFRYIVTWFNEFSELQRDDFVPVLVEYLTREEHSANGTIAAVYTNGIVNSLSQTAVNDKPLSLFQCRLKLFRQWTPKWPMEFKHKLKEKIIELDAKVGEKIINEIKGLEHSAGLTNGTAAEAIANDEDNDDDDAGNNARVEEIVNAAAEIVAATEEAINADNRLVAALLNTTADESSVDDVVSNNDEDADDDDNVGNGNNFNENAVSITNAANNDNVNAHTQQQQQHVVEPVELAHVATVVVANAAANNAEVPLTA